MSPSLGRLVWGVKLPVHVVMVPEASAVVDALAADLTKHTP
jgi:hypothetical protein